MSHLTTLHDESRASAVVRVLSPVTQAHVLLSRAIGFIADGRNNLAEESLMRAEKLLERLDEINPEAANFGNLRAMTVSGMLSSALHQHQSALRAHETVAETMPDSDELVSDDREETAAHVAAFLKLHGTRLEDTRRYMRYNFEGDYAELLDTLEEAN